MSYKVHKRSEHDDIGVSVFKTYRTAARHVRKELVNPEAWGARRACIVHPDGTREYWRTEITLVAIQAEDDWCDE